MTQYTKDNPIRSVDGRPVKCPSSYNYTLEDLTASDAGRTEDLLMHKKRIGQSVQIDLSWQNLTTKEVSELLQIFNPQYLNVCYFDAMSGLYKTSVFYVSNRSVPMYSKVRDIWSNLSFNLTERSGK